MVTAGEIGLPTTVLPGCWVRTKCAEATSGVMVKLLEVADVYAPSVTFRV